MKQSNYGGNIRYDQRRGPTKTFRQSLSDDGGRAMWIEKKPSPILLCECGLKYIKTRRGQKTCVFCITGMAPSAGQYDGI